MNRLHELIDSLTAALILALFDVVAWALNHTPREPW